ncbi:MAG: type II toxin-antitoxin system RelB/DinJ family antitoxin [Bacilli bacterium]
MASKTINISVEEATKAKAQAIFESLGMSFSTGINVYLEQVVLKKGIPFALRATGANEEENEPPEKKPTSRPSNEKAGVSGGELSLSEILNGLKDDVSPKKKKRK